MYYYRLNNKILFSIKKYSEINQITEEEAKIAKGYLYAINNLNAGTSRRSYVVSTPSLLFKESEGPEFLRFSNSNSFNIPNWLIQRIAERKVIAVNTCYSSWKDVLNSAFPEKWKINIAGLGDVGGILLSGLRLMGKDYISNLGIYDVDENKMLRWEFEINQILPPFTEGSLPVAFPLSEKDIFDCDMFVFCVSLGVPPLGKEHQDVRMAQYEGNSKIVNYYAKKARATGFKGIFAVISDPVDMLCKSAFLSSNTNDSGVLDYKGLVPDQIRGYGLGVMNARASYFASLSENLKHYLHEGRVFGPHGNGLIVADSIENYNDELSSYLTEKTINANMQVRKTGFKPYIAPALSSGALSLIATIRGDWHYSSTFMGGVFMGSKNRLTPRGTELELLNLPDALFERIRLTYQRLGTLL